MMKILISPCLYTEGETLYNLFPLKNVLSFIHDYLDGHLDRYSEAFYSPERLHCPPVTHTNEMAVYNEIISLLYRLQIGGDKISLGSDVVYSVKSTDYVVTNKLEMQIVASYLHSIGERATVLLFLGERNRSMREDRLQIEINSTHVDIPTVKDPWLEKSSNFNEYLKKLEPEEVFCNRKVCKKLDAAMKNEASQLSGSKGALFKKYGEIIALRNKYKLCRPQDPHTPETDYYLRDDGKYIISVDLLHGHFEVFKATGKKPWINSYNFAGEKIERGSTRLKEMRNSHKI